MEFRLAIRLGLERIEIAFRGRREKVPAARRAAGEERWEAERKDLAAAWNSFLEALMVCAVGLRRLGFLRCSSVAAAASGEGERW